MKQLRHPYFIFNGWMDGCMHTCMHLFVYLFLIPCPICPIYHFVRSFFHAFIFYFCLVISVIFLSFLFSMFHHVFQFFLEPVSVSPLRIVRCKEFSSIDPHPQIVFFYKQLSTDKKPGFMVGCENQACAIKKSVCVSPQNLHSLCPNSTIIKQFGPKIVFGV